VSVGAGVEGQPAPSETARAANSFDAIEARSEVSVVPTQLAPPPSDCEPQREGF